ncbi:MAG: DUF2085 domain-containing protein [Candidatus Hodarchaeales archaeon]|jgi:uncharacterized membrane protein
MNLMLCYCLPERSIKLNNVPIICYRCFGILLSLQILLYILIFIQYVLNIHVLIIFPFTPFWIFLTVILIFPLLFDGYTQKWEWRLSSNGLRFITGISFGIGMQIWILWVTLGLKKSFIGIL